MDRLRHQIDSNNLRGDGVVLGVSQCSVRQQIKSRNRNDHAEQLRKKAEMQPYTALSKQKRSNRNVALTQDWWRWFGCAVVDFDGAASLRPFHLHLPFGLYCLRLDVT